MEKNLWPDVSSKDGRAFAFQLASAGAFVLAGVAGAVILAVTAGFSRVFGYPLETQNTLVLTLLTTVMICSLTLGFALRRSNKTAAWTFALLVIGCFFADAWWGSGSALWLIVVLTLLSLQGLRAALSSDDLD